MHLYLLENSIVNLAHFGLLAHDVLQLIGEDVRKGGYDGGNATEDQTRDGEANAVGPIAPVEDTTMGERVFAGLTVVQADPFHFSFPSPHTDTMVTAVEKDQVQDHGCEAEEANARIDRKGNVEYGGLLGGHGEGGVNGGNNQNYGEMNREKMGFVKASEYDEVSIACIDGVFNHYFLIGLVVGTFRGTI